LAEAERFIAGAGINNTLGAESKLGSKEVLNKEGQIE
jgi:hypothetical protein